MQIIIDEQQISNEKLETLFPPEKNECDLVLPEDP